MLQETMLHHRSQILLFQMKDCNPVISFIPKFIMINYMPIGLFYILDTEINKYKTVFKMYALSFFATEQE